jgi:hypothetical protein
MHHTVRESILMHQIIIRHRFRNRFFFAVTKRSTVKNLQFTEEDLRYYVA